MVNDDEQNDDDGGTYPNSTGRIVAFRIVMLGFSVLSFFTEENNKKKILLHCSMLIFFLSRYIEENVCT